MSFGGPTESQRPGRAHPPAQQPAYTPPPAPQQPAASPQQPVSLQNSSPQPGYGQQPYPQQPYGQAYPQPPAPQYGQPQPQHPAAPAASAPVRPTHAPQPYSQQQYATSRYTPRQFQQRPTYSSALEQPTAYAPPAPAAPGAASTLPGLAMPTKRGRTVSIWVFGVLGFVLLALIGYYLFFLGPAASGVGLVLALIPLAIVFLGVRLIDRWEPEPKRLVFFAIGWGAIASIGITLLVGLGIAFVMGRTTDAFSSVIQAPVVEELSKALGIFIVFLMARRTFDGPVDGIVYGALVGGGFAFTENIQYFGLSLLEGGGGQLTATFIMRGLMSPFAHAMFTALTGFAMGLAARKHASAGAVLGFGSLGLIGAMLLHAFWNGSALFADFFLLYITLQVPLFVGFIFAIVALRREEARLTKTRLTEYADAGWFTPEEVTMLATPAGRKVGLAWAASLRGDRRPLMREFIKAATALAAVRQRAVTGRDPLAVEDEQALLARTRGIRASLLAY